MKFIYSEDDIKNWMKKETEAMIRSNVKRVVEYLVMIDELPHDEYAKYMLDETDTYTPPSVHNYFKTR